MAGRDRRDLPGGVFADLVVEFGEDGGGVARRIDIGAVCDLALLAGQADGLDERQQRMAA